jgi:hypothetical protein
MTEESVDWMGDPLPGCRWIPCRDCQTAGYDTDTGETCPTCTGLGALMVEIEDA